MNWFLFCNVYLINTISSSARQYLSWTFFWHIENKRSVNAYCIHVWLGVCVCKYYTVEELHWCTDFFVHIFLTKCHSQMKFMGGGIGMWNFILQAKFEEDIYCHELYAFDSILRKRRDVICFHFNLKGRNVPNSFIISQIHSFNYLQGGFCFVLFSLEISNTRILTIPCNC